MRSLRRRGLRRRTIDQLVKDAEYLGLTNTHLIDLVNADQTTPPKPTPRHCGNSQKLRFPAKQQCHRLRTKTSPGMGNQLRLAIVT